jgi:hypothetical protein
VALKTQDMYMKYLFTLLLLGAYCTANLWAQNSTDAPPEKYFPSLTTTIKLGDVPPLTTLEPQITAPTVVNGKSWKRPNNFFTNEIHNTDALPQHGDPLVSLKNTTNADQNGPELIPGLNFDGMLDTDGITPPDPTGDIGLNHYVQMVNVSGGARFQIWNKQGQSVYGPAETSTIWNQVQSTSIGDPIIQYDHDAQRWLMMEMQGFGENQLLVALSNTSDPTGGWKVWRIQCQGFPDYPKLYVWKNAYFITINEIVNSNVCSGYALDKAAMLNGTSNVSTYRFVMPNFNAIQYQPATGADWEGGPPPPAGSPGLIFRVYDDAWDGGIDQIQMWQINVDWANQNANFAFGPIKFPVAPFETRVCFGGGLFDCIEQPNTSQRITALENIIMYRAPYRNFGTHESVVLNHVTDVSNQVGDGGDAAVRWYELRKNSGEPDWFVYQQGTYAPDLVTNRFMGTLSMDEQGNIGLGYSVASNATFPGIRLTGRRKSDPLGQMTVQEYNLVSGGKSHQDERWGDYSTMAVDPVDGKTFWFTAEYQPANKNWGTRIGNFQIRRDTYDITPIQLIAPVNASVLENQAVTVKIQNGGLVVADNCFADLYVDNVLLSSETINGNIPINGEITHTFQPLLTWININEVKNIRVVTRWAKDQFTTNDTLKANVKQLTSFDAAIGGIVGLPNLICASDYDLKMILRNTSGLPLDSAQIRWRLNQLPFKIQKWYGHLLPGQQDTVTITLIGIPNVQNLFNAQILLPNGQQDQDTTNNKVQQKITTNIGGAYLTAKCNTIQGSLKYEIRYSNNSLLSEGIFTKGVQQSDICSNDGICYTLKLKSTSFQWDGLFQLHDIYGNVLASITSADPSGQSFNFCVPNRKNIDVGAFSLISPKTGSNLTANEPVVIEVKNLGIQKIGNSDVAWRVDGGAWTTALMTDSIIPGTSASYAFLGSSVDIAQLGQSRTFEIKATVAGDEIPANDARTVTVTHKGQRDVAINSIYSYSCNKITEDIFVITVENTGLSIIDSITFKGVFNGTNESTFTMQTFGLFPGVIQDLYPTQPQLIFGNNTIDVSIIAVNGIPLDDLLSNNSATTQFNIDENKVPVSLAFTLDDRPKDTSWELRKQSGALVANGGNYDKVGEFDYQNFCLEKDSCYVFKIFDSVGDGFAGFAYLTNLSTNLNVVDYNGFVDTFSSVIAFPFCAYDICNNLGLAATVTQPNNANMNNGRINLDATGGTPPYRYSKNNGVLQVVNIFTGLVPGIYNMKVVDSNNCETVIDVQVGSVATISPTQLRQVELYPNPTAGPVWISLPAQPGEDFLTGILTNSEGKELRKINLARFDDTFFGTFSIQKNPAGTYFLSIMDRKGQKIAEKRIQKI